MLIGPQSQCQSFVIFLREYGSGELKPCNVRISCGRKYTDIDKKYVQYLEFRASNYKHHNCGISWIIIQE